jgi:hypothetical protein
LGFDLIGGNDHRPKGHAALSRSPSDKPPALPEVADIGCQNEFPPTMAGPARRSCEEIANGNISVLQAVDLQFSQFPLSRGLAISS